MKTDGSASVRVALYLREAGAVSPCKWSFSIEIYKGYLIDNKDINIGNEIVSSLKSNRNLKWVLTNQKDADEGVMIQKYFAVLVIPEEFTEKVSGEGSINKTQGILYFKANDKKGSMAASMMTSVSDSIEVTINKSISTNVVDHITSQLQSILAGKHKIGGGLEQKNLNITSIQGLGKFIAQPVKLENIKIAEAKNTGTALSPFMISLCLYIGGLMIMITLFSMESLRFKETKIAQKIKFDVGLFRYQIIGILQAILIAVTVHVIIGLNVQNQVQFYGICILGSLAFTTLIQLAIMLFKEFGKILCLLLMMCQLTSGGGVLPVEILPVFYKNIYPYMPMTYTIDALRNVILGIEPSSYHFSIGIITGITIISAILVILISFLKLRKMKVDYGFETN